MDLVRVSTQLSRAMEDLTAVLNKVSTALKAPHSPSLSWGTQTQGHRRMWRRRAICIFLVIANLFETGEML